MMNEDAVLERERLINTKDVERLLGMSRVTVYRRSIDPKSHFPEAFRDGSNYTRWRLSEILEYRDSLRKCGPSDD